MFDEEFTPRKKPQTIRNLEDMGIAELEEYILELKSEIVRTEQEIEKKKKIRDRAASVFK